MAEGLVHVYYGNGKGKTTAALGLCVRACGCGKKAVIVQFLKSSPTGEVQSLACLDNVTLLRGKGAGLFVSQMTEEQKAETRRIHGENLQKAVEMAREALRLAELRYEAGIATWVEVQSASASALEAEAARIQAAANLLVRMMELSHAVGDG